jgi:uncharacterized membrane protein|tara:strand:+ start:658 stop:1089 length:432 start_codon:yes stop_codon:yes gene_type:complete
MKLLLLTILTAFLSSIIILFQQHYILKNLTKNEFFCIKNILLFIVSVFYILFINKNIFQKIQNLDSKIWIYIFIDVFISVITIILWYFLLQNTDAHKLVNTINPLTILFITIISYFFYKKKISIKEIVGIILILLGLYIFNIK